MPDWKELIRRRLENVALDPARESEIIDELALHLEDRYEELRSAGACDSDARRQLIEEFEEEQLLDEFRRLPRTIPAEPLGQPARGAHFAGLLGDLRLALRNIRTKPAFSSTVIGILALGVAGNSAIFSIVNALFLRPLPFAHAERLVDLSEAAPRWGMPYAGVSNPDFYEWRKNNSTFEGMAFFSRPSFNLSDHGAAQRVEAAAVSYDMLDVVGLKPALGRSFLPEEDRFKGPHVLLLGYRMWQRKFGADRSVLGRIVKLDNEPYTVVGILPPEPVFPDGADLWVPLQADPDPRRPSGWYLSGIGRLKPGVTTRQATADLLRVHKAMIQRGLIDNEVTSPILTSLRERYLGDFRPVSKILLGGVAVVLLLACVNIAALMLVRGAARSREIAIRVSIGASRRRIVRQLLTENLVLAAAGGVLGVAVGQALLRLLLSLMPVDALPHWVSFAMDVRFAVFCLVVTGTAALLFGLLPAVEAARAEERGSLQPGSTRSTFSRGRRRMLGSLVVCEIGLALVLLAGGGSILQSFRNVLHVDPGFQPDHVISFSISVPDSKYPEGPRRIAFFEGLVDRLRAVAGVKAVGAASAPPLGRQWGNFWEAEGSAPQGPNEQSTLSLQVLASPGYFDAIGMTFLAGHTFRVEDADSQRTRDAAGRDYYRRSFRAVVVNESFAKRYFPGVNPLGRRIRTRNPFIHEWIPVVGVTRDEKHYGLDQEAAPEVYLPYRGVPDDTMDIVIRGAIDPQLLIAPTREILRRMDTELPMYNVRTMTERLNQSLWARRAYSWLFASFAMVALLLAAAGVYGVVSYAVSQRTQEIGIRMALGAQPAKVLREVLANGMALVGIGVALGMAGAFWAVRLLQSLLFGVSARDPLIFAVVIAAVTAVGLLANFVPARRASSIDPMRALHFE